MLDVYLFAVVLAVSIAMWLGPSWRPRTIVGVTRGRPLAIGHRGVVGPFRENEVPAFQHAFDRLDGIETDVQMTADGVLVLWHDFDLDGRDVSKATVADLLAVHPGLTTLDTLFALARKAPGTLLNLELKSRPKPFRRWRFERAFVAAVRASDLTDRILVSSFDPLALARVRLLDPSIRVGVLVSPDLGPILSRGVHARWLHADAIHPHWSMLDSDDARGRPSGLAVHVWTVNEASDVRKAVANGATGVIGDDPSALLEGLDRRTRA